MEQKGESNSFIWTLQKLKSSSFLKPFSCIGILYFMTEAYGVNAVIIYMPKILREFAPCNNTSVSDINCISTEFGPIIVGSLRLLAVGKGQ